MGQIAKEDREKANQEAHANILRGELDSVSKSLNEKLSKTKLLNRELKYLYNDYDNTVNISENLKKDITNKLNGWYDKKNNLDERENKLNKREQELNSREEILDRVCQEKLNSYNQILIQSESNIDNSNIELNDIRMDVSIYKDIFHGLQESIKKLKVQSRDLDSNIILTEDRYSDVISNLDNELDSKRYELSNIKSKILKEQQKIELPIISLDIESKKLDKKKRNLDIIIRRFNKTFKKHYPLTELKL